MLKAGKLDKQITIEREVETVAASGAVSTAWQVVATVRAELVQRSADEFLTGFGEAEAGNAVFRIRYLAGLATADRVICGGVVYGIEEIAEQGRRRALELHCVHVG